MLTSKEVLEKTGISRATLNNYISWGVVPRPQVLPPEPTDGAAPRIGYFPDDIVERIEEIQRLKREGWSLTRITEHFAGKGGSATRRHEPAQVAPHPAAVRRDNAPAASPALPLDEILQPAYLVNSRFEVVWANAAATSSAWPNFTPVNADPDSSVFGSLLRAASRDAAGASTAVVRLHVGLAKQRGSSIDDLCRGLAGEEGAEMRRLHAEVAPFDYPMVVRVQVASGAVPAYLYALSFQRATLFMYVPGADSHLVVAPLLPAADDPHPQSAPATAPSRAPALTEVAVLAADLQDAHRLWSELPAAEYFELINEVWLTLDPILRRHGGTNGKHPGEGLVCYFLPRPDSSHLWNALAAAHQVRDAVRDISRAWRLRKGWSSELFMNIGLDEGQEWRGTLRPGADAAFTVLGDSVKRALRISHFARDGAVWVTKNLVGKLSAADRRRLKFGVRRRTDNGETVLVASTFATVENLAAPGQDSEPASPIAQVPLTEVIDIAAASSPPDRAAGQDPA